MVFSDPRATERLNAIMHPLIRAEAERRIDDAAARPPWSSTTCRCWSRPGRQDLVDLVVVVDVPEECSSTGRCACAGWTRTTSSAG